MALVTDSLTIPPAGSLNATGQSAAKRQLPAAAERAVVPVVYGEDRISGLLLNVLAAAGAPGTLLVQVLWCHACTSVEDLRLNDAALPASATVTHYTGSQTTPDAALVAAFSAQGIGGVGALTGYAWSLIAMPAAAFDGQLNFTARIRGRKVYDPEFDSTAGGSGSQRLADPSTWDWRDVPALCLADFLANTVYGAGQAVDWASVRTTAAANRAIVPGTVAERRRVVGVSFTVPASTADVAETLRAYAGCFLLPSASGIRLLPDANDAPVAAYRHADGQIAAIEPLELRDLGQAPTAVEVIYTDTSAIPWRDASEVVTLSGAGTTRPWRLSQVRMPGIHRAGQARREATERLNKLVLNDITTTLEVFDEGIRHELGDIVTVTHPLGLAETAMRVSGPPTMPAPGRWRLPLVRHNAAAYSDAVATAAATVDGSRLLPIGPPAGVEGLVGAVSKGVVTWRWTPCIERYYMETRLRIGGSDWDSATPLWSGRASQLVQQVGSTGVYLLRARHAVLDGQESETEATFSVTVTTSDLDASAPDLTPAPTPTGAGVTAGFASLFFEQDLPTYTQGHGHGKTRVYGVVYTGGAEPVISSAEVLTEFTGTSGAYPTTLGTAWRIWLKWVTNDGVESVTAAGGSGSNGLAAQTGLIGGANIAPLAVEASKLAEGAVDLGGDKVTGTITDPVRFGAAAIGYTVTQYLVATSGVLGNLVVDNAQIANLSVAKLLGGTLSVSAYIQSQGYSAGVSGWRINADGSAEFGAASIRGQLSADQINGNGLSIRKLDGSLILDASGSGTPIHFSSVVADGGWLNSNIGVSGGVLTGIGTSGVQVDNSYAAIGQNLIPNSDQSAAMTWVSNSQSGAVVIGHPLQWSSQVFGAVSEYTLRSATTRNVTIFQTNEATGNRAAAAVDVYPMGWWGADYSIPVRAGQRYWWSYYAQGHRCDVGGGVSWFRADGTHIGSDDIPRTFPTEGGAQSLDQYVRVGVGVVAPAGAALACPYMRKYDTIPGQGTSWFWAAAPQFEAVQANAQGPSPYMPGPALNTRQLGYTGDLNATLGADWSATVFNRPSNLAGLGGSEVIRNDWITIDAAGKLQGIGAGAGVTVSNNQIAITINANGTVSVSGGPSVGGGVTLSGLGAGAMAAINAITEANASTYLAGAIIDLANIKLASINTLSALSSYLGAVEIATGGHLRSGKTSFADSTAGFWLANVGGVPELHVGSSAAFLKFSTTHGFELKLDTFTASVTGGITVGVANGTQEYGGRTVTVAGGVAPYTYTWAAEIITVDPPTAGPVYVSSGQGTATVGLSGRATNGQIYAWISCQVVDSNGRVANAGFSLLATHGTYTP